MKTASVGLRLLFLMTLLGMLGGCSRQEYKADVKGDAAKIKEALKQYEVAVNSGDFEGWISLWDEDGVQMPPNAPPLHGKVEIVAGNKPWFDDLHVDLTVTSVDEVWASGDLGVTRCTYSASEHPKADEKSVTFSPDNKALTVWKRQADGSWKILYDCFNSSLPPE